MHVDVKVSVLLVLGPLLSRLGSSCTLVPPKFSTLVVWVKSEVQLSDGRDTTSCCVHQFCSDPSYLSVRPCLLTCVLCLLCLPPPPHSSVSGKKWTHMLDLAETSIGRGGWTHRRLDGTMSQQRRESALKAL